MNLQIDLYGVFRQFGRQSLVVDVPESTTVKRLRDILRDVLKTEGILTADALISVSVFATDDAILKETDKATNYKSLAILPPVCGG